MLGHVDGSVQDCTNSSALAMELLQSCTKPSMLHPLAGLDQYTRATLHTKFPQILGLDGKMTLTLKVKVKDPHFQYQLTMSQDASLVQVSWFQLKSVKTYRADKVKYTGGHTDTGNDNTPSAWKAKG